MIPLPYKILGGLVGALVLLACGVGIGAHYTSLSYKAAIAQQKADAQKLIADRDMQIASQIQANAELNRKLEADHAQAEQRIGQATDAYNAAVAERMRPEGRRISCGPSGSSKATDADAGKDVEAAGIIVSQQALQDIGSLMREADELVETMKQCKAFADSVGR